MRPAPTTPVHDLSFTPGRTHLKARQRGADITAVGQLLAHVPALLCSLGLVYAVTQPLPPTVRWAVLCSWSLAGSLVFFRPFERALARYVLVLGELSPGERARLAPIWREVTARAGVDAATYELWVEDSDEINAAAAAGHVVAVTRAALARLSDAECAAVLAHELGHHTGGHAWSTLLGTWYAAPARLVWRLLRSAVPRVFRATARTSTLLTAALLVVLAWLAVFLLATVWWLILLLVLAPYAQAAVGRRAELRADAHAAALGFAPQLMAALAKMEEEGDASGTEVGRDLGVPARLLTTHPETNLRLRRLAEF